MAALIIGPAAVALGQVGQGPFSSGIQIVNLGTSPATVTVIYYNPDGSTATEQTGPIPAEQSVTFFPLGPAAQVSGWTGSDVPSGFNGSVVISANQPVTAVSNLAAADFSYLDSYNGFSGGATSVTMPIIQRNNAGFSTWFAVQNAGTSAASVSVSYTPGLSGSSATEGPVSIAPGASSIFNQSTNTALGDTFVGSATITSDRPVVLIVNQEQAAAGAKNISSYPGLTSTGAAPTVQLPLIQGANAGFLTGVGVTNVGTAETTVTVSFGTNLVSGGCTPGNYTQTLAAGAGFTKITQGGFGDQSFPGFDNCTYVGSATITTSPEQNVVAVVNQLGGRFLSSYAGFTASEATATVIAPLVQSNNGGFSSAFQLQNIGTTDATGVTVSYSANSQTQGGNLCSTPAPVTGITVPAGGSVTIQQSSVFGTDFLSAGFTGCTYVGSATVNGPANSQLVAIVNQLGGSGDALLTYRGVNQ